MALFSPAFLMAFGLTFAFGAALRLLGGAARGRYLAEAAVALGFAAGWYLVLENRLLPYDPLSLTPVLALGGACVGVALNLMRPRRLWAAFAYAAFTLLAVRGLLTLQAQVSAGGAWGLVLWLVVAALWLAVLARFDALARHAGTLPWLLAVLAGALAAIAALGQEPRIALAAGLLAAALLAHALWYGWLASGLGDALILPAGMGLLGLATALILRVPLMTAPLCVLGLTLFAPATVQTAMAALPGGLARIARLPLVLAGACVPALLAVICAWVLGAGPWGR